MKRRDANRCILSKPTLSRKGEGFSRGFFESLTKGENLDVLDEIFKALGPHFEHVDERNARSRNYYFATGSPAKRYVTTSSPRTLLSDGQLLGITTATRGRGHKRFGYEGSAENWRCGLNIFNPHRRADPLVKSNFGGITSKRDDFI